MTHEPECWIPSTMDEFYAENGGCYVCQTIRSAYQRGREDAAKAVRSMWLWSDSQIPNKTGLIRKITIFEAERIALNIDASELTQHYLDISREDRL